MNATRVARAIGDVVTGSHRMGFSFVCRSSRRRSGEKTVSIPEKGFFFLGPVICTMRSVWLEN